MRLEDAATLGTIVGVEGGQELLDVERDAVRPRVDGLDDVAWRGQVAAEDQRRGDAGLIERQRAELDLLRRGAGSSRRARHSRWIVSIGNSSAR